MTVENDVKDIQPEVEDIEVEVTESQEQEAAASNDDELENYTKSVSKRINKLNARNKASEDRINQLEAALHQSESQRQAFMQDSYQQRQNLLREQEEKIEIKEREANDLYKRAHAAGDAELMSKADSLKNEVSIQKEKVRIAKQRQEQAVPQQQQNVQQQYVEQPQQQAQPQPTQEALDWANKNKWYGSNAAATDFANFTHINLVNEGYEPDSDDYYEELNQRVYKVFSDLQSEEAEQSEGRPAVQRVASASVGSRQKTQGKKNGVSFSKTEVERLRGLKPHGMSEDVWLKSVAKEKQRIATREAK